MSEIDDLATRLIEKLIEEEKCRRNREANQECDPIRVKDALKVMKRVVIKLSALSIGMQDTLNLLDELQDSVAIRILKKDILPMKELVENRLNHIRGSIKEGEEALDNA